MPATVVLPRPQQPGLTTTANTRFAPAQALASTEPRWATLTSTSPSTRCLFRSSRRTSPRPSLPAASFERSGEKLQPKVWPASGRRQPRSGRNVRRSTRTSPGGGGPVIPYRGMASDGAAEVALLARAAMSLLPVSRAGPVRTVDCPDRTPPRVSAKRKSSPTVTSKRRGSGLRSIVFGARCPRCRLRRGSEPIGRAPASVKRVIAAHRHAGETVDERAQLDEPAGSGDVDRGGVGLAGGIEEPVSVPSEG